MLTNVFMNEEPTTGISKVVTTGTNAQADFFTLAMIGFGIGGIIGAATMTWNAKMGKTIVISCVIGAVIAVLSNLGTIEEIVNGWVGNGSQPSGTVMIMPLIE